MGRKAQSRTGKMSVPGWVGGAQQEELFLTGNAEVLCVIGDAEGLCVTVSIPLTGGQCGIICNSCTWKAMEDGCKIRPAWAT